MSPAIFWGHLVSYCTASTDRDVTQTKVDSIPEITLSKQVQKKWNLHTFTSPERKEFYDSVSSTKIKMQSSDVIITL